MSFAPSPGAAILRQRAFEFPPLLDALLRPQFRHSSFLGYFVICNPVAVTFAGRTSKTTDDDDRSWSVTLPAAPDDSTPQKLTVQSAGKTLTLDNILVGDAWVLGGQSNMEFPISKVDDGMLEIVSANSP